MVRCPNCQATLPDGAGFCQFCQTNFAPVGAPPGAAGRAHGSFSRAGVGLSSSRGEYAWAWKCYYAIAGWWVLSGLWTAARPLVQGGVPGLFAVIAVIFGLLTAAVGLGLILNVNAVRGVVNFLAFLQILGGILDLLQMFALLGILGIYGIIGMIMAIVQILLGAFMIFLIGETETRAPGF